MLTNYIALLLFFYVICCVASITGIVVVSAVFISVGVSVRPRIAGDLGEFTDDASKDEGVVGTPPIVNWRPAMAQAGRMSKASAAERMGTSGSSYSGMASSGGGRLDLQDTIFMEKKTDIPQ